MRASLAVLLSGLLAWPAGAAPAKGKKKPEAEGPLESLGMSAADMKEVQSARWAAFSATCYFGESFKEADCVRAIDKAPAWLAEDVPGMRDHICWEGGQTENGVWDLTFANQFYFLQSVVMTFPRKNGGRGSDFAPELPRMKQNLEQLLLAARVQNKAGFKGSLRNRGGQITGNLAVAIERMEQAIKAIEAGEAAQARGAVMSVAWQALEMHKALRSEPLDPWADHGPVCPDSDEAAMAAGDTPEKEMRHYAAMGGDFFRTRRYEKALEALTRALGVARRLQDLKNQETLQLNIALTHAALQNSRMSIDEFEKALAMVRARKSLPTEADMLRRFAGALQRGGFTEEGAFYERLAGKVDDQIQVALDGFRRGVLLYRQGRYADAKVQFGEPARLVGHPLSWMHIGLCESKLGKPAEAAAAFREAARWASEHDDVEAQTISLIALVGQEVERGETASALDALETMVRLGYDLGKRKRLSESSRLKLDGDRARNLSLLEGVYSQTERWDRASAMFTEVQRSADAVGDPDSAFRAGVHRGRILAAGGKPEEAVASFSDALRRLHASSGEIDASSAGLFVQSLLTVRPYWDAALLGFMAELSVRLGAAQKDRRQALEKAVRQAKAGKDPVALVLALARLAGHIEDGGEEDARRAIRFYQEAAAAAEKAKETKAEAAMLRRRAAVHAALSEQDERVAALEQALTLVLWEDRRGLAEADPAYRRLNSSVRLGLVDADPGGELLKELAFAYLDQGRPVTAAEMVHLSLQVGGREHKRVRTLSEFAERLEAGGYERQAGDFLKKLLEDPGVMASPSVRVQVLTRLALVQRKAGGLGEDWALENLEEALRVARTRGLDPEAIPMLVLLGQLRLRKGEVAAAAEAYETAVLLTDAFRAGLSGESAKIAALESDPVHALAMTSGVGGLFEAASREPALLDRALRAAERMRSRALLEALGGTGLAAQGPLKQEETAVAARMALLVQKRIESGWGLEDATQFAALQERLERLAAEVRRTDPADAALRYPEASGVADVQAVLRSSEAFVTYRYAPAGDVYATVIRPGSAKLFKLEAEALRAALQARPKETKDVERWKDVSRGLGVLWEPLEPELEGAAKVIIAPDHGVFDVPWAAIESKGQLLVEKPYALQVVPSASVLVALRKAPRPRASKPMVAFAPFALEEPGKPRKRSHPSIKPLPSGRKSMEALKRLFPGAEVFLPPEATKQAALAASPDHRYVVYDTHGLASESDPGGSAVFFTDAAGREEALTAAEAMRLLKLDKAELVVLSACQTAKGKKTRAEGVMGLTRALLYAGAKGVVATSWSVADQPSADLVTWFFEGVESGQDPAQALQRAQRAVRAQTYQGLAGEHPFLWAAFQIYGDPSAGRFIPPPVADPAKSLRADDLRRQLDAEFRKDEPDPSAILRLQRELETEQATIVR